MGKRLCKKGGFDTDDDGWETPTPSTISNIETDIEDDYSAYTELTDRNISEPTTAGDDDDFNNILDDAFLNSTDTNESVDTYGEPNNEFNFNDDEQIIGAFPNGGGKKRKSRRKGKKSRKSKKVKKSKRKGKKSKKRVTKRRRFYGGQPALTPAKWTERDTYYVEPTFK